MIRTTALFNKTMKESDLFLDVNCGYSLWVCILGDVQGSSSSSLYGTICVTIFFKTNQMTKYTKICLGDSFEYIILADHEQVSGSWFPCLSVKIEVSFLLKHKAVQSSG